MHLNQLLKTLRIKNKLTQEELAMKMNVSHQTISKWENGINSPSIDNLLLLSDLYEVSLDELVRGSQFFRKPFLIGKKPSFKKVILFSLGWLFVSLFFTGFGYQPFWLFLLVYCGGILFLLPTTTNDYWLIEKSGITVMTFPKNAFSRLKAIILALLKQNKAIHFRYSEIKELEIVYLKKERYSPFDINPDSFFIRLVSTREEVFDLPITPQFIIFMPQAISYIEKKRVIVKDSLNIINAILENKNIFTYIHTKGMKKKDDIV